MLGFPYLYQVLIETLWNVKFYCKYSDSHSIFVLIETLWNVKSSATATNLVLSAF